MLSPRFHDLLRMAFLALLADARLWRWLRQTNKVKLESKLVRRHSSLCSDAQDHCLPCCRLRSSFSQPPQAHPHNPHHPLLVRAGGGSDGRLAQYCTVKTVLGSFRAAINFRGQGNDRRQTMQTLKDRHLPRPAYTWCASRFANHDAGARVQTRSFALGIEIETETTDMKRSSHS